MAPEQSRDYITVLGLATLKDMGKTYNYQN